MSTDSKETADHPERTFNGIQILFRKSTPIDDPKGRYPGFRPGSTVLPKGSVHRKNALPLPCDIVLERDVAVPLRDGVVIYSDIYRPQNSEKVPAIVAWSPYGKKGGQQTLDQLPGRLGIPVNALSDLQAWEGPDPAYWCNHGYAVVNADARGAFKSEGDIYQWGSQEGKDGHDLIEWLASQSWCNGRIGLSGNSWLAVVQWFIAATRPPHLAAIAPWEGFSDFYRNALARGGIADTGFNDTILDILFGNNRTEDTSAMIKTYPMMNAYWQDKAADLEKIEAPAYVAASYTNPIHTYGTFEGYRRIGSHDKWLRVHNAMEWTDYYNPQNKDDLRRFFDRFLKGIDNGWQKTPRVRLSVLDPGHTDETGRAAQDYPPSDIRYQPLYLDAETQSLLFQHPVSEAAVSYPADDGKGKSSFTIRFNQAIELIGHLKLRLWVEARGADDMDLFVLLQKLSTKGKPLTSMVVTLPNPLMRSGLKLLNALGIIKLGVLFYSGPNGKLRVSHRQVDAERSTPAQPYHTHTKKDLLSPGHIVPVDIQLNPIGMRWHAGEQLRITVAGYDLVGPMLPGVPTAANRNKGVHIIHTGARFDSHLLIPVKP